MHASQYPERERCAYSFPSATGFRLFLFLLRFDHRHRLCGIDATTLTETLWFPKQIKFWNKPDGSIWIRSVDFSPIPGFPLRLEFDTSGKLLQYLTTMF